MGWGTELKWTLCIGVIQNEYSIIVRDVSKTKPSNNKIGRWGHKCKTDALQGYKYSYYNIARTE